MMTRKLMPFLLVMLSSVIFHSCKKYEDGPMLSLRSKTARVCNTWKVEKYIVNGNDQTQVFQNLFHNYMETYREDGVYGYSYDVISASGKWEFQNDKNEIKRYGVSSQSSETMYILRLKEKEFWYSIKDGSDDVEIHLIPAN